MRRKAIKEEEAAAWAKVEADQEQARRGEESLRALTDAIEALLTIEKTEIDDEQRIEEAA